MRRRSMALRILVVALLVGCSGAPTQESDEAADETASDDGFVHLSDDERSAVGLALTDVTSEALPEVHVRFGRVLARPGDEVVLVAPVTARVVSVTTLPLGSEVAEDSVLVTVVPVLGAAEGVALASAAAELRGQVESAEEELALRQATLERARALAPTSVVSPQAVQEAETSVQTTQAQLDALRRATTIRARGGRALTLLAPRAGVLVEMSAISGAVVQPGEVLARVVAAGPRLVDVAVPSDEPVGEGYEIARGSAWAPATLVSRGRTALGLVRRDRLLVDALDEVPIGAEVPVRVAGPPSVGPVVPEPALVPRGDGEAVYVEREPGIYELREVRVAARFGGRARIAEGLRAGERVVTTGAMALWGQALRSLLGDAD